MTLAAEMTAPPSFEWKRWPETEKFLDEAIEVALSGNSLAATLARRMPRETGTQFKVWVDHLVMRGTKSLGGRLLELGYERRPLPYSVGVPLFTHSNGMFPPIALEATGSGSPIGADPQVSEVAHQGRVGGRFLTRARSWSGNRRLPDRPLPHCQSWRQRHHSCGGRAPGLSRV